MAESQNSSKQTEAILHAQDYFQILRSRWKEALFVFILVFACCAVITYITTPMYKSRMNFEVKHPRDMITLMSGENPITTSLSDSYMQTEFEAMVSERNLCALARKEGLDKEWGTTEQGAAGRLAGMIAVMPVKGTNLVDVTVTSPDPKLSKRVCAAVEKTYADERVNKERGILLEALNKRKDVLKKRKEVLEGYRRELQRLIDESPYVMNLWSRGSSATSDSLGMEEEEVHQLANTRRALEAEIAQMRVHIGQLKSLKDDGLRNYAVRSGLLSAESYSSGRVRELNEAYKKEEEERDKMLLSGYGPKHPHVLQLDNKHATTQRELYSELAGMRDAMSDRLEMKAAELNSVQKRYETAVEHLRSKTTEDRNVMQAVQDYQKERDFCDKMEKDILADEMRMELPRKPTEVYSTPVEAGVQSSPNVKLNLIVGAIAGLIAGIVVAVIYNFFDTSVKSLEDAERQLHLPVLGVIPQDAGLLIQQDGESPDVEAYRILRTNIELKKALFKSRTYAVVSANAGEGKTTTLSNLAYVFAKAGCSTLMVDADMRRPRLARYALIDSSVGLSNYLTSDMQLKDVVFKTGIPNLYILPSGPMPGDASGLLSSFRMDQLLSEAAKRFDIVLFDSPPLLGVSDASIIVSKVDATLVVIQPRKMPIKALHRAKSIVENVGGQIMGLVMNNVDISTDSQYQYYTTYYSYYSSDSSRKDKKMPAAQPVDVSALAQQDTSARQDDPAEKELGKGDGLKTVAKVSLPEEKASEDADLY